MDRNVKSILAAVLVLAATFTPCGEEYQIPWSRLKDAAQRYLNACVKPETRKRMAKRFKERVEQRMEDSGWDEDTVMRTLMLDWAAGNRGNLERKEPTAVGQACFYFVIFINKGYFVPVQIREALNEKNVNEILDHLEKAIKTGEKRS